VKRYLLDTNVVSEARKMKPHGAVLAWLRDVEDKNIYLSAVTIGELQMGVEQTRRQDPAKASEIELWIDQLADSYQVLSMDTACFREWARLMSGRTNDLIEDAMIAATARIHQLTVATRNERDFAHLGVSVVNPFSAR
jgi:predicted nucleic acid-binding protein